jgi:hypothetical protein
MHLENTFTISVESKKVEKGRILFCNKELGCINVKIIKAEL